MTKTMHILAAMAFLGSINCVAESVARRIAEQTMPSVVMLVAEDSKGQPQQFGSAFFIAEDTLVSNWHVVRNAARAYGNTVQGNKKLRVVGAMASDCDQDLVLLKTEGGNGKPLKLADFSKIAVGDEVFAVGNPQGLEGTFSGGMVSSIRNEKGVKILQVTAPISEGSSGGPVVNTSGEVVGVATATIREGQNLNFAVPSVYIAQLMAKRGRTMSLTELARQAGDRNAATLTNSTALIKLISFGTWDDGRLNVRIQNSTRRPLSHVQMLVTFDEETVRPPNRTEGEETVTVEKTVPVHHMVLQIPDTLMPGIPYTYERVFTILRGHGCSEDYAKMWWWPSFSFFVDQE